VTLTTLVLFPFFRGRRVGNLFGSVLIRMFLRRYQIIFGSGKLKIQQQLESAPDAMPHLLTLWAVQSPRSPILPMQNVFLLLFNTINKVRRHSHKIKQLSEVYHQKNTFTYIASKKKVIFLTYYSQSHILPSTIYYQPTN